jgi:hypothetical protein
MNFSQAIEQRGVDERKAVANMRRSTTMRYRSDRTKIWPRDAAAMVLVDDRRRARAAHMLSVTQSVSQYVEAWCVLNYLKM